MSLENPKLRFAVTKAIQKKSSHLIDENNSITWDNSDATGDFFKTIILTACSIAAISGMGYWLCTTQKTNTETTPPAQKDVPTQKKISPEQPQPFTHNTNHFQLTPHTTTLKIRNVISFNERTRS